MATTLHSIDLTPFGFTPTETAAYCALLDRGPSSGYAVGQALSIARANAYQALHGLSHKGGARILGGSPQRFRAVAPEALLAVLVEREASKLDLLEQQVGAHRSTGAPQTQEFTGQRALRELALRLATRAPGTVHAIAPIALHTALLPIWRKRAADGAETALWVSGDLPEDFPILLQGSVSAEALRRFFGTAVAILLLDEAGLVARLEDTIAGYWTSDPLMVGAIRAAAEHLTQPA